MIFMKVVLHLVLCLLSIPLLVACGGSDENAPAEGLDPQAAKDSDSDESVEEVRGTISLVLEDENGERRYDGLLNSRSELELISSAAAPMLHALMVAPFDEGDLEVKLLVGDFVEVPGEFRIGPMGSDVGARLVSVSFQGPKESDQFSLRSDEGGEQGVIRMREINVSEGVLVADFEIEGEGHRVQGWINFDRSAGLR